jgi:hypothetical protein
MQSIIFLVLLPAVDIKATFVATLRRKAHPCESLVSTARLFKVDKTFFPPGKRILF